MHVTPSRRRHLPVRLLSLSAVATALVLLGTGPASAAVAAAGTYSINVSSGASFSLLTGNNLLTTAADDKVITLSTTGFGARRLPFPLKLYIAQSSTVSVSTNGNLQFTATGTTAYDNDHCLPDPTFSVATVMPFFDDLYFDPSNTGQFFQEGVFTRTAGVKPHRTFTVSWQGHRYNETGAVVLAQVVFSEGSPNPTFLYGAGGGGSATVGVQAKGLIQSTQWECNGAGTASGVRSGQKLTFIHHNS